MPPWVTHGGIRLSVNLALSGYLYLFCPRNAKPFVYQSNQRRHREWLLICYRIVICAHNMWPESAKCNSFRAQGACNFGEWVRIRWNALHLLVAAFIIPKSVPPIAKLRHIQARLYLSKTGQCAWFGIVTRWLNERVVNRSTFQGGVQ